MTQQNDEKPEIVAFHPSPYMVGPIDTLLQKMGDSDLSASNLVVPDLLDRSADGIPASVDRDMRLALETVDRSAVVLCTCSTLGGHAEAIGDELGLQVIRIDRPMAEEAIAIGGTIGLAAAVPSTLEPTRRLLESVADDRNVEVDIRNVLIESAWTLKQNGDAEGYIEECERVVRERSEEFDVIVLAQGSMSEAADRCRDLTIPILTSPASGVRRIIEMAETHRKS